MTDYITFEFHFPILAIEGDAVLSTASFVLLGFTILCFLLCYTAEMI